LHLIQFISQATPQGRNFIGGLEGRKWRSPELFFDIILFCKRTYIAMNSMKGRMIFYVPGMISLLMIPILMIYFIHNYIQSPAKYAIEICWADETLFKRYPEMFGPLPPKRNYVNILLSGNNIENKQNLRSAQFKIRNILFKKDTLNGVHFEFNDSSEYWTLVKAIDICLIENAERYIPYKNHLWFFYAPRPVPDTSNQIPLVDL
jgi:hypothetical protein